MKCKKYKDFRFQSPIAAEDKISSFKENGFSLIEIIIALGIVTTGIISIVSMFNDGLRNELISQKKLTAVYLAQEAIEVVRWQRDTNWKKGDPWDNNISTGEIIVGLINEDDITDGWEVVGSTASRKKIYYHTNDYYVQSKSALPGLEEISFKRWLTVSNACGVGYCLEITANVSHPDLSQDIQISTRIYDWM